MEGMEELSVNDPTKPQLRSVEIVKNKKRLEHANTPRLNPPCAPITACLTQPCSCWMWMIIHQIVYNDNSLLELFKIICTCRSSTANVEIRPRLKFTTIATIACPNQIKESKVFSPPSKSTCTLGRTDISDEVRVYEAHARLWWFSFGLGVDLLILFTCSTWEL